jgi:hypothetical protein
MNHNVVHAKVDTGRIDAGGKEQISRDYTVFVFVFELAKLACALAWSL